jgi:predicted RNA-binding protein
MSQEGNPEPYLKGIKELIMADYSFIEYKNDYINLVTQIAEHLNQIKGQVDALDIANNPNKEEGIDYNDYLIRDDSDEPSDVDSFEDEKTSYEFYDSEDYDVVSWGSNSEDESGL